MLLTLQYFGITRSISWLLMPWRLASPGHQQPWYWRSTMWIIRSSSGVNFNNLQCFVVKEWCEMQIHGLAQNCSVSSVNALEILQSCTTLSKYVFTPKFSMTRVKLLLYVIQIEKSMHDANHALIVKSILTLLVLRPEYSVRTRLMAWLLMPWLLASPGHQQPWYLG